ncbi:RIP metalloprotease RseP [Leptothrix discophora]|uniref:RIP metalloprotease RseP n=1 Tax=Leptothrix discophora TaxID=89 RepID=A0ABT9G190_LEPDI|nr:RIP metalloprotease RseP [Leptothrix discophora]MDP4300161.1 RIP metalloprotease RseP [Leptothrix discophora]
MNTLLSFLLTLAVLIAVHEWGHYRAARACNVKVLRFSIGFGRPIWRRLRGETEWVVGLLPLGGYVRMLDEREAPVAPEERHRAFNLKPLRQRAFIVVAGPLANLVLAVLLYAAAHWVGTDEPLPLLGTPVAGSPAEQAGVMAGDQVLRLGDVGSAGRPVLSFTELRWQLTRAALDGRDVVLQVRRSDGSDAELHIGLAALGVTDADPGLMRRIGLPGPLSEPVLGDIVAGGAAERAGLRTGDRVLSVDGHPVTDGAALRAMIRAAARDVDARPATSAAASAANPTAVHAASTSGPAASPAFGTASAPSITELAPAAEIADPLQAAAAPAPAELPPGSQLWHVDRAGQRLEIVVTPAIVDDRGQRVGRIEAVVGSGVKMALVRLGPVDGLTRGVERTGEMAMLTLKMLVRIATGEASPRNLSGPLTIAEYAGQSVQLGLAYYLGFLAVVSVSLGVLNLLPLPMLDGGHLLFYAVEAVFGRPIPDAWIERLQRGGLFIILVMMSLALYNDVARLFGQM